MCKLQCAMWALYSLNTPVFQYLACIFTPEPQHTVSYMYSKCALPLYSHCRQDILSTHRMRNVSGEARVEGSEEGSPSFLDGFPGHINGRWAQAPLEVELRSCFAASCSTRTRTAARAVAHAFGRASGWVDINRWAHESLIDSDPELLVDGVTCSIHRCHQRIAVEARCCRGRCRGGSLLGGSLLGKPRGGQPDNAMDLAAVGLRWDRAEAAALCRCHNADMMHKVAKGAPPRGEGLVMATEGIST